MHAHTFHSRGKNLTAHSIDIKKEAATTSNSKLTSILSLLIVDGAIIVVIFLLFQLDWLVNDVLYDYGLQFNPNWTNIYWIFMRVSLSLLAFSSVVTSIAGFVSYKNACLREKMRKTVVLCKSCGTPLAKSDGNVNWKSSMPKFKIMKTCPFCDEKLLEG